MALPKYKTSRANTHSRRANWKAKRPDRYLPELRRSDAAAHGMPELRFLPRPRVPRGCPLHPHQVSGCRVTA